MNHIEMLFALEIRRAALHNMYLDINGDNLSNEEMNIEIAKMDYQKYVEAVMANITQTAEIIRSASAKKIAPRL